MSVVPNITASFPPAFISAGNAVIGAVPGLFTACVIFYLARLLTRGLDGFFERVLEGEHTLAWLDADVAVPTRRIAKVLAAVSHGLVEAALEFGKGDHAERIGLPLEAQRGSDGDGKAERWHPPFCR